MNIRETSYINRDNKIVLVLSVDNTPINHSIITRVQLNFGTIILDSLTTPNAFDLTNPAKLTLSLGSQTIPVGKYKTGLYIYDLDNIRGVAWGTLDIVIAI